MPPQKGKRQAAKRKQPIEEDGSGPVVSPPAKKVRWNHANDSESEVDELQSDDDDDEHHLCLTVTCIGGKLGAAFYDQTKRTVYLVEDTTESSHFDLSRMLFEQAKPDLILAPSRADEDFLSLCREYMEERAGTFQVRPHREFVPDKGRNKMLSLAIFQNISGLDASSTHSDLTSDHRSRSSNAYEFMQRRRREGGDPAMQRQQASIRMANYTHSDIPLCLSALGALLDYLVRAKASGDLEHEGIVSLDIQGLEILAIDQVMQIDSDALSSLQIFEDEGHASMHSGRSKEGLSLFGILDFTKTPFGRSLLRQWCLRPSLSILEIEARHDAIACFTRGENIPVAEAMHSQLRGMKNAPRSLSCLKRGKGTTLDWQTLVKFTYHISILMEHTGDLSHTHSIPLLEKLNLTVDTARLKEMGSTVNETIDWETSENERRTCVRPHVDEELDRQKQVYHGLDNLLSKVALEVKTTIPPGWADSLNVLYFPQLGYLICVPLREEWTDQSDFEAVDGWTYQFSSDTSAYFKNQHMHDLDEHIGDLHTSITDREIEIIHRLEEVVLEFESDVIDSCNVCAELDCLLSFAMASRMYDYCRPQMVEENILHIKRGRHPLVERVADVFVANDAYLVGGQGGIQDPEERRDEAAEEFDTDHDHEDVDAQSNKANSIAICTGANACGKSVYLKQNALIPFMAQIGCFVPAESATLGVVDKIFTRLQTRESVSKIQSTFMIDLSQVSLALRNATSRSLVLLDEFGNGTTPADGAGLFCGVIQHLLGLKNETDGTSYTPKVFAATHFHEIFVNGLLDPNLRIDYMHMEAMLSKTSGQLVDMENASAVMNESTGAEQIEIHYLYRLSKGLSLNSHATKCALMYGVPKSIVSRAEHVSELLSRHELGQLLDEDLTDVEQKDLEDAESVCRAFLAWDLDQDVMEVKDRLSRALGLDMDE